MQKYICLLASIIQDTKSDDIQKLIKVEEKVTEIEASVFGNFERITDMFKLTPIKREENRRKRSQKENRRKAKKRKASRKVSNMEKIQLFISNALPSQVIDKHL